MPDLAQCDGTTGSSAFGRLTFSGLMVYDVSVETGFRLRGRVAHPWPVSAQTAQTHGTSDPSYYACSDWWTDSSSVVERSGVGAAGQDRALAADSDTSDGDLLGRGSLPNPPAHALWLIAPG